MLIALNREEVALARRWSDEVLANVRGRSSTGLELPDRYFHGYMGEIGTDKVLNGWAVPHLFRVCTNGRSQKTEFWVEGPAGREKLEVKTSSELWHKNMLINVTHNLDDASLYVGAKLLRVDESIGAELDLRCCTLEWLRPRLTTKSWGHGEGNARARGVPLEDMAPMERLAKHLGVSA